PGIAHRRGRRARDRAPGARDATHREPSPAPRARLRARPWPRGDRGGGRALRPRPGRCRLARSGSTGPAVPDGNHRSLRRRAGGDRGGPGVGRMLVGRGPWLGRLPGDIHIQRGNWTFYFPLATSLLLSVVLTLILWILGRR